MAPLTYFAYGSNMLTERLRRRVRSARPLGPASLAGWQLRFHKRGQDGSAKCNIVQVDDAIVHGVVFTFDASQRHLLDAAEGLGNGYELADVRVSLEDGPADAFCYVASPDYIEPSLEPFEWYRDFVLYGALEHDLPSDYRRRIQQRPGLADRRVERARRKRRILQASKAAAKHLHAVT